MNVLFICSGDLNGPSEKHALGWAEGLLECGHQVLLALRGDVNSESGNEKGVRVVPYRFVGPKPNAEFLTAAESFQPTIVHAFNPRSGVISATQAVFRLVPSTRVCVHFEDDEWGLASARATTRARGVLRLAGRVAGLLKPDLWPFATRRSLLWAIREAHGLDALTPILSAYVAQRSGRDCSTLLPVPARGPVVAQESGPPQDLQFCSKVVLYTGAVYGAHLPDFLLLLRAIAILRSRGTDVGLVHTGQVARRLTPSGMLQTAGLKPSAARFLGYVPSAVLSHLLREADVLVQPGAPTAFNHHRLPSKLAAYLASGSPTITFAVGFGTMLRDRVEVLKTHGPTPDELADRIGELLTDTNLAAALRVGGPQAAKRLFDRDRNTEALISYYRHVLVQAETAPRTETIVSERCETSPHLIAGDDDAIRYARAEQVSPFPLVGESARESAGDPMSSPEMEPE